MEWHWHGSLFFRYEYVHLYNLGVMKSQFAIYAKLMSVLAGHMPVVTRTLSAFQCWIKHATYPYTKANLHVYVHVYVYYVHACVWSYIEVFENVG